MLDVIAPVRPAEDILARIVRITLGGKSYVLPVRSIRANREWKETFDERTKRVLEQIRASDDADDTRAALVSALSSQINDLIDLLVSYDSSGILPTREEIEDIEPDATLDIIAAVREVLRAADPLVAIAIARQATRTETSSPPTSSPPVNITGRRRKSKSA